MVQELLGRMREENLAAGKARPTERVRTRACAPRLRESADSLSAPLWNRLPYRERAAADHSEGMHKCSRAGTARFCWDDMLTASLRPC